MAVHKVFRPSELDKEIADIKLARQSSLYRNALDKMLLKKRNSNSRVLTPPSKKQKVIVSSKKEELEEISLSEYIKPIVSLEETTSPIVLING